MSLSDRERVEGFREYLIAAVAGSFSGERVEGFPEVV
jgi:hypothetical protein